MQICQLCHKNFKILQKGRKKKNCQITHTTPLQQNNFKEKKLHPKISANMGTELRITATTTLGADDHVVRNVNNWSYLYIIDTYASWARDTKFDATNNVT